eukprot:15452798-Alexandrium_andersonii.AAC.1
MSAPVASAGACSSSSASSLHAPRGLPWDLRTLVRAGHTFGRRPVSFVRFGPRAERIPGLARRTVH